MALNFPFLFSSCLVEVLRCSRLHPAYHSGSKFSPSLLREKVSDLHLRANTPGASLSEWSFSGRPVIHDSAMAPPAHFPSCWLERGVMLLCFAAKKTLVSAVCSHAWLGPSSFLTLPNACFSHFAKCLKATSTLRANFLILSAGHTFMLFIHLIQKKGWAPVIFQIY